MCLLLRLTKASNLSVVQRRNTPVLAFLISALCTHFRELAGLSHPTLSHNIGI